MAATLTGGCLCGAIRYEFSGEPGLASNCYCRDCQRSGGSPHSSGLRVATAGFRITKGKPKFYTKTVDSGNQGTRAFCPECGSQLFGQSSGKPDMVGIRVCSLDDPSWFRPAADIFVTSAQPWDYMNPDLPKYPDYPPGQSCGRLA